MAACVARILRLWGLAGISLLVAVALAMSSISPGCSLSRVQLSKAQSDLWAITTALEHFRANEGNYPDESLGLNALMPDYVRRLSMDPWGNPYVYRRPDENSRPLLHSRGADELDSLGLGDDVIPGPKEYRCEDYDTNCLPSFSGGL